MSKWKVVKPRKDNQTDKRKNSDSGVKKRIKIKFLPLAIVTLACVAILVWALPALPVKPQQQAPTGYKGVLELWNVETFEGGIGSREAWLINKASKFEQSHTGLFVHVTSLTVEQLQAKLDNGEAFDMICFSRGAGSMVQEQLAPISQSMGFVRDNFLLSAQLDSKQYAMPLYAGVYCLFARVEQLPAEQLLQNALTHTFTRKVGKNTVELQPMVCGFTQYNSPLSALAMSGGHGKASSISQDTTQYQAYEQFVANRTAVTLLGTQRDMYRLSQKESNGKIEQLGFAPLGGYTDLVQYVGVSNNAGDKSDACTEYVSYLLSETTQSTLVNLSLFSVLNTTFYTSDRYAQCEQLLSTAYVPNVFGDADAIARQRDAAISTLGM
ncbi:MAG: hypothetical protein J1G02_05190 [Clostridiales bacterium]|nr:hypothetical protein [Clostridiales bacterium]